MEESFFCVPGWLKTWKDVNSEDNGGEMVRDTEAEKRGPGWKDDIK